MLYFQVWFELCYRPLVQVEEPQLGQKRSYLTRGCDHQAVPRFPQGSELVIYLKTLKCVPTSRLAFVVMFICQLFFCATRRSWSKKRSRGRRGGTPHASTSPCARRLLHGIAAPLPAVCALCQLPHVHSLPGGCPSPPGLVICYHCYNTYDHSPCSCLSYGRRPTLHQSVDIEISIF